MKLNFNISALMKDEKVLQMVFGGVIAGILVLDLIVFVPLFFMISQAKEEQKTFFKKIVSSTQLLKVQGNRKVVQLLSPENVDQAMDDLSQLADKNNVELTFKEPTDLKKTGNSKDSYSLKEISADLGGTFKNLGTFFLAVKELPSAIVDLEDISISRNNKDFSNLQAQTKFVFYMVKKNE